MMRGMAVADSSKLCAYPGGLFSPELKTWSLVKEWLGMVADKVVLSIKKFLIKKE